MSISRLAVSAREGARRGNGQFGTYSLESADTDTDLDMDLDWLDEDATGDFGAEPQTPETDEVELLRLGADDLVRWMSDNSSEIGWATPDGPAPDRWAGKTARAEYLSRAPMRTKTAETEELVTALGTCIAARAEQLAGVEAETERAAYAQRLDQAQDAYNFVQERSKALEKECEAAGVRSAFSLYLGLASNGREGQFTDQMRAQINSVRADMSADADAVVADRHAASTHLSRVKRGRDPQSIAVLSRLSGSYSQVLSEVRQMGGTPGFHAKSTKPARTAFVEAAQVFPADWVAASNEDPTQMLAKISRRRAHYAHTKIEKTKKRVRSGYDHRAPLQDVAQMNAHSNLVSYELVDATPDAEGQVGYRASYWQGLTHSDPARPPKGRGWEGHTYTDRHGEQRFIWRQPSTRMRTVASEVTPEILTNRREHPLQGRSDTFEVAVHESAHRFEATVAGITDLERAFLDRRCRDAAGDLNPLRPILPGEYARKGDFVHDYVGKEYSDASREVLSMGTQALFGGAYGGLIGLTEGGTADTDHRDFTLGLLASVGRRS